MKNYIKITAEDVKKDFSNIAKRYIGPNAPVSYKRSARELEVEERTLGSWIRGENPISLLFLIKIILYLPPEFRKEILNLLKEYECK